MSCLQDIHIQKCNCIYESRYPFPLITNRTLPLCDRGMYRCLGYIFNPTCLINDFRVVSSCKGENISLPNSKRQIEISTKNFEICPIPI